MKTEPTQTATQTASTYQSTSRADKSYPFTSALGSIIEKQYPGLISAIGESGLLNGSKLFTLFFTHTIQSDTGKKQSIEHFLKNYPVPKKYQSLPSAPGSGLTILSSDNLKNQYPAIYAIIGNLSDTKLIITLYGKSRDYRTIHHNYRR